MCIVYFVYDYTCRLNTCGHIRDVLLIATKCPVRPYLPTEKTSSENLEQESKIERQIGKLHGNRTQRPIAFCGESFVTATRSDTRLK